MSATSPIDSALSSVATAEEQHVLMRRNGRPFMALPCERKAAIRILRLYRPQRFKAHVAVVGLQALTRLGLHRHFLPPMPVGRRTSSMEPPMDSSRPGSAGVMLGSPEHRVQRAILCYETSYGWEVAKLAFGIAGREVIEAESAVLAAMPDFVKGAPGILGVHHGPEFSLLRLPYLDGSTLRPSQAMLALELLESWVHDLPTLPASEFPEWPAITAALATSGAGKMALARLAGIQLTPAIRHGDFARWNLLLQDDGKMLAIDWEWGHTLGMPGIDLVHLFSQDARLVRRLKPQAIIRSLEQSLSAPRCRDYLGKVGWGQSAHDVILASLAFTVGTQQQENEQVLESMLAIL